MINGAKLSRNLLRVNTGFNQRRICSISTLFHISGTKPKFFSLHSLYTAQFILQLILIWATTQTV